MTEDELTAIENRASAATKGPWRVDDYGVVIDEGCNIADLYEESDAAFIAHARADIPALIAEVRRLRLVLDEIANLTLEEYRSDPFWPVHHATEALEQK